MMEFTAQPQRTFALVVGIAEYQESSWNVKSAATVKDALKFAEWLLGRGVLGENIKLCLSPLKESQDEESQTLLSQCRLPVMAADLGTIEKIITNFLSQQLGDLLYIFWAGHGLITSERNRRLFCADLTKQNWQNIYLKSLLLLLRSHSFQIRNHICIIDTCANYLLETDGRPTNLGGKKFDSGKPRKDSQQFVLLATREGEKAKVRGEGGTGYFSQAVRSALDQASMDIFPPNMKVIAEKVKEYFKGLEKNQLPTYLSCDSGYGEEEYYFNPFDIHHDIPQSATKIFIGRDEEIQQLHKLLQINDVVAITDITGEGGVGKTELAKQYAWRKLEDYSGGCCWLNNAEKADNLGTQLITFGLVNFNFNFPQDLGSEGKIKYGWRNWQPGKVLLVFDDVIEWRQIQRYLPPISSRFKVLITTRKNNLPCPSLPLGGLPEDEALELFKNLARVELNEGELPGFRKMCQLVGYKPLEISVIASLTQKKAQN